MMDRSAKAAFYAACGPAMKANAAIYRWLRAPKSGKARVHLGPGLHNYIPDWINVDANMFTGKCDVWADLRNPLPFADNSIEAFYSHHVVEHLASTEKHFQEVYRCLRPGGVYRVGAPNGDSAIRKFMENDAAWFSEFPDNRRSIGGRFENFIFCRGEHLTIFTYSFCEELMADIGFTNLRRCLPKKETRFPDIFRPCMEKEWESDFDVPHTLIIEAEKPALR
jgi:predicted SAM-dependent methyltransferase